MIYLLAYIGGIILNLMPCVLPVLMLKVMSLHRRRSWQYVAGVMSVFFCLGVGACGPGFIWGGQFDHLWFTWGLAAIVFALGLSYLDVWTWPNFGFREAESDFGKGVLTTILSSACSGPFLGAVFAASLAEPWWKVITLFLTIGVGLCTPYLFFPRSWVPNPGAWMETFKKLAGVSLILTAAWLIDARLVALSVVVLAGWAGLHGGRRLALVTAITAGVVISLVHILTPTYHVEKFNDIHLWHDRHWNRIVIVEFTSNFCMTCQWNEATLKSRSVARQISRYDVVVMRAVMPNGSELLKELGFTSVPVLAIFPGDGEPIVLPDVITKADVITSLEIAHAQLNHDR